MWCYRRKGSIRPAGLPSLMKKQWCLMGEKTWHLMFFLYPQIIHCLRDLAGFSNIFHHKPSSYWVPPIWRNPHSEVAGKGHWWAKRFRTTFATAFRGLGFGDAATNMVVPYIVVYIYIFWVDYNDLTVLPHWESWLIRRIIPKWPNYSGYWNIIIYPYMFIYLYIYIYTWELSKTYCEIVLLIDRDSHNGLWYFPIYRNQI